MEAEKELTELDRKRNNAQIVGQQREAKRMGKQMRDIFHRVLFGTYADLLLDREEVGK